MPLSDRAFHALAQHEPQVVLATLRVLCPELASRATLLGRDDLAPTRLDTLAPPEDADWLARLDDDELLHLECQGYRDAGFPERLLRYHLALTLREPERRVRTIALWLTRPPDAQRVALLWRGDVCVRVTQVVLAETPAEALLASPHTACFAPGADAGAMDDATLCARAAALLAAHRASWYQRHMAVVTALSKGRYDVMTRAMEAAGFEPLIIEDLVYFGEDRGLAKGEVKGEVKGLAKAVLQVAALRGLALTDAQRERVAACADAAVLERWHGRAVTAPRADDIFAGE